MGLEHRQQVQTLEAMLSSVVCLRVLVVGIMAGPLKLVSEILRDGLALRVWICAKRQLMDEKGSPRGKDKTGVIP